MSYIISGRASKLIDDYCINTLQIPSLVLMERAALGVAEEIIKEINHDSFVGIICGVGNNGADGLAVGRILYEEYKNIDIYVVGSKNKATEEFNIQMKSIKKLGITVKEITDDNSFSNFNLDKYDVIVDGIFGIGLSRNVSGIYERVIERINNSQKYVLAMDIASGLNSSTGEVMGCSVFADKTVTFGYKKAGLLLCDGKNVSGNVCTKKIGFQRDAFENVLNRYPEEVYEMYDDLSKLSFDKRIPASNKGTFGCVTVIGGSEEMAGAVMFSAEAAYRLGVGIVRVYTHENNLNLIKIKLPECITDSFDNIPEISGKSIVVIGPGLGINNEGKELIKRVLESGCRAVIDADGLNIISSDSELKKILHKNVIITPHIKEMSRLTGFETNYIRKNIINVAKSFSKEYGCVVVLKDAATVVTDGILTYINTSGNNGMSTGGSGDVLSGIASGIFANKESAYEAAKLAVYIHGCSGDAAANKKTMRGMIASDILDSLPDVLRYINE